MSTRFLLRRLHSLTGIIPIGVFLLEHLYTNAKAQYGPEVFNRAVRAIWEIPYLWAAEIGLIALPLLFHGVYGFVITYEGDVLHPAPATQTGYLAAAYALQRVTGAVVFVFLAYHVWHTRIQWLRGGPAPEYDYMKAYLAPKSVKALYVLGVLCACYHLAHGIVNFATKWGLARSALSQARLVIASLMLFLFLSAVGVHSVFAFR